LALQKERHLRLIRVLSFILFFTNSFLFAQNNDVKDKMLRISNKIKDVPSYKCDVSINLDVKFINIKERSGKMFYTGPNDIEYKIKGFAFLPKKELSSISFDLFEDDFIAINLGETDSLEIIKVIPLNIESEIVTGQFWINKNELIKKMIVITKEQGSFEINFNYNNNEFDLPSSLVMTFDVKNQEMPALLTGDFEVYYDFDNSKETKQKGKGKISIKYKNFDFNYKP